MSLPPSLSALADQIEEVKLIINDSQYLNLMNTLGELYKEVKKTQPDNDDDEETIILSEGDKIVVNQVTYYGKSTTLFAPNETVLFSCPEGDIVGILEDGELVEIDWIDDDGNSMTPEATAQRSRWT